MPIEFPGTPDSPVSALDVVRHYQLHEDSDLIDPLMTMAGYSDEQVAGVVVELEAEIARQEAEIVNLRRIAEIELYATTEHSPIDSITADLAEMKAAADRLIADMRDLSPRDLYAQIDRLHSLIEDNCDNVAQKAHNYAHAVNGGEQ